MPAPTKMMFLPGDNFDLWSWGKTTIPPPNYYVLSPHFAFLYYIALVGLTDLHEGESGGRFIIWSG